MTDLGELKNLLGQRITRNRKEKTLKIDQEAYVKRTLEKFRMENCRPISTPAEATRLSKPTEEEEPTTKPYSSLVGSIVYASSKTRPDIAYATSKICQFMSNATDKHWTAAKRVLHYLQATPSYGITFKGSVEPPTLIGYADADFGGDPDDRKSTTGYVFLLCGGAISWRSKKQPTPALSPAEAEYMAAAEATQEAIWLRQLLKDLKIEQKQPTTIFEDNQGCIAMTKNNVYHSRTKHIDIKYHFIRTEVENHKVTFVYKQTADMIADIFTKPLEKQAFVKHRAKLIK